MISPLSKADAKLLDEAAVQNVAATLERTSHPWECPDCKRGWRENVLVWCECGRVRCPECIRKCRCGNPVLAGGAGVRALPSQKESEHDQPDTGSPAPAQGQVPF